MSAINPIGAGPNNVEPINRPFDNHDNDPIIPSWISSISDLETKNSSIEREIEFIDPKDPKNIRLAIDRLTEKLQSDPQNLTVLIERGDRYLELEEIDKAEVDFKNAFMIDMKNPFVMKGLGLVAYLRKSYSSACNKFLSALKCAPADAKLTAVLNGLLAHTYNADGKYDKAIPHFEIAIEESPEDVQLNKECGYAYMKMKEYGKAIVYFDAAYNEVRFDDPLHSELESLINESFGLLKVRYNELVQTGRFADAIELLDLDESAIDCLEDQDQTELRLMTARLKLKMNFIEDAKCHLDEEAGNYEELELLAECNFLTSDHIQARNIYQTAAELEELEFKPELKEAFLAKAAVNAYCLKSNEGYKERKAELERKFPRSNYLKLLKGMEYFFTNPDEISKKKQTLENCRKTLISYLEGNPTCLYGNFYLARNYIFQEQYNKAIRIFTKVIERNPYDYLSLEFRAKAYELSGDPVKACEDYTRCVAYYALEDEDNNLYDEDICANRDAVSCYAYYVYLNGNKDFALKILKRVKDIAEELEINTDLIEFNFARISYDLENYAEAMTHLDKISKEDAEYDIDVLRIKCYLKLGTRADLVKAKQFCKLYPGEEEINKYLRKINLRLKQNDTVEVKSRKKNDYKEAENSKRMQQEREKREKEIAAEKEEKAKRAAENEAESIKQKAAFEEAKLKRAQEASKAEKELKEKKRLEAEIKAAATASPNILQPTPSSGSGRVRKNSSAKSSKRVDFTQARKTVSNQETSSPEKTKSDPAVPVEAPKTPPIVIVPKPVPAVQIFNNALNPKPVAAKTFAPEALRPIAEVIVKETDKVISLKETHKNAIDSAVRLLNRLSSTIENTGSYDEELLKRLILLDLRNLTLTITLAKHDSEFAIYFEKILNNHTFSTLHNYIHSETILYNLSDIVRFCKGVLNSGFAENLTKLSEASSWPQVSSMKGEKIIIPSFNELDIAKKILCIQQEILMLHKLSKQEFNFSTKRVFKLCLQNIVDISMSPQMGPDYSSQFFISSLKSFILRNPFDSVSAVTIANRLYENFCGHHESKAALDFLES